MSPETVVRLVPAKGRGLRVSHGLRTATCWPGPSLKKDLPLILSGDIFNRAPSGLTGAGALPRVLHRFDHKVTLFADRVDMRLSCRCFLDAVSLRSTRILLDLAKSTRKPANSKTTPPIAQAMMITSVLCWSPFEGWPRDLVVIMSDRAVKLVSSFLIVTN